MTSRAVDTPGGYVAVHAIAFGSGDGVATFVDAAHPLPVASSLAAASSTPLAGTLSASGQTGPFAPQPGRDIWLTLSGVWAGTVQLLRSIDNGATKLPLTLSDGSPRGTFYGAMNAPVADESVVGATYYLQFTAVSGTLSYRMEQ